MSFHTPRSPRLMSPPTYNHCIHEEPTFPQPPILKYMLPYILLAGRDRVELEGDLLRLNRCYNYLFHGGRDPLRRCCAFALSKTGFLVYFLFLPLKTYKTLPLRLEGTILSTSSCQYLPQLRISSLLCFYYLLHFPSPCSSHLQLRCLHRTWQ
jgi:hypothetical protein